MGNAELLDGDGTTIKSMDGTPVNRWKVLFPEKHRKHCLRNDDPPETKSNP